MLIRIWPTWLHQELMSGSEGPEETRCIKDKELRTHPCWLPEYSDKIDKNLWSWLSEEQKSYSWCDPGAEWQKELCFVLSFHSCKIYFTPRSISWTERGMSKLFFQPRVTKACCFSETFRIWSPLNVRDFSFFLYLSVPRHESKERLLFAFLCLGVFFKWE